MFGTTSFYPFSLNFSSSSTSFLPSTLTIASGSNDQQSYQLQPYLFFVPSFSSISSTSTANESLVNVVGAHLDDVDGPVAIISFPTSQVGTLAPKMITKNVTLEAKGTRGVYTLVSGNVTVPTAARGQVTVDVVGILNGEKVIDEFNFVPQI